MKMEETKPFFDYFDFIYILSKGKNIWINPLSYTNGVEIRIVLQTGARFDPPGKEGLAHLVEHMLFKGSTRYSAKEIDQVNEDFFLDTLNAQTGYEYTAFTAKIARTKLVEAMEIFKNIIFLPIFPIKELINVQRVIIQEIREALGNSQRAKFLRYLRHSLYGNSNHPTGRLYLPSGWEETVEEINWIDIVDFHHQHYFPKNFFFIFTGDISIAEAKYLTNLFFQDISISQRRKKQPTLIRDYPIPNPNWIETTCEEAGIYLDSTQISIYRILPSETNPAMLKIYNELIQHMIYTEMRESLGSNYQSRLNAERFSDHVYWNLSLEVDPQKKSEVISLLKNFFSVLQQPGNIEREFKRIRSRIIEHKKLTDYEPGQIADLALADIVDYGKVISLKEEIDQLSEVTLEQFCQLSQKLDENKLYWVIIDP